MAGLSRGYEALKGQLGAYFSEPEADGEKVSLDPLGTWRMAAMELTQEIMVKVSPYMRTVDEEKEDSEEGHGRGGRPE
jgi:hypothetical protein